MLKKDKICSRCVLTSSFPRIDFDNEGVCSICHDYDNNWGKWNSEKKEKKRLLEKVCIQAKGKNKDFDALVPLSGGKDSTYVLYVAQKELGLRCLAYTLDTGYLSDFAKNNINRTCKELGVEHIYYRLDPDLLNRLFSLFIKKTGWFCSVCMRAIEMSTFRIADMYRVPLIITGSSMRTELPLTREMFQSGDVNHVVSVLDGEPTAQNSRRFCSKGSSFRRNLGCVLFLLSGEKRLFSYAHFNLANYVDWDYEIMHNTISRELSWTAPTESEHMDCIIHPIQRYIHNRRFPDVKMRRLTLARYVMAGLITREEALSRLEEPASEYPEEIMNLFLNNLKMTKEEFDQYVDMGPRHLNYHPEPNFRYRLIRKIFSIKGAGEY